MNEKNYLVTEKALSDILNYLSSRPYFEVYKLVQSIQASKLAPSEPELAKVDSL